MATQGTSAVVVNLQTTEKFFDHFEVEVWDSGQTTLVQGPFHVSAKYLQASGCWLQQDPLIIRGLVIGTTYSLRSRVMPSGGGSPSVWSAWAQLTAGDLTPPNQTYSPSTSVTAAGLVIFSNPVAPASDTNHYEFFTNLTGAAPVTTTPPNLPPSIDGSVRMVIGDNDTVSVWIRAVDTSGNRQAWTALGAFNSNGAVLLARSGGSPSNILANPGFESNLGGYTSAATSSGGLYIADSWFTQSVFDNHFSAQVERVGNGGQQRTGGADLKISLLQNVALASGTTITARVQNPNSSGTKWYPVRGGDYYYFGGWAKWSQNAALPAGVTGQAFFQILFADINGAFLTSASTNAISSSGGYQCLQGTVVVPPSGAFMLFQTIAQITNSNTSVFNTSTNNYMDVRFDDCFIYKAPRGTHTQYRPLTNPLTASDIGTSVTISIASFTMRCGSTDVPINAGAVLLAPYNTTVYIYYDDNDYTGGPVVFNGTTTREVALAGEGRFYVGSILTPQKGQGNTTGNNDGGGGSNYAKTVRNIPSGYSLVGNWVNPQNAIDNDPGSFAEADVINGATTMVLVASGFTAFAGWFTSNVLQVITYVPNITGGPVVVEYSTNLGQSWTTMRSVSGSADTGVVTSTATLPNTLPTQNVVVRITSPGAQSNSQNFQLYAGLGADDSGVGTLAWTNPTGPIGNPGNSEASATNNTQGNTTTTHYLKLTNFGFSIPSNATIVGIVVTIKEDGNTQSGVIGSPPKSYSLTVSSNAIGLYKAGVAAGNAKGGDTWAGNIQTVPYGSSSDLWGTTWLFSDINNSGFGVRISANLRNTGVAAGAAAGVLNCAVTIYYTTPGGVTASVTQVMDIAQLVTT